VHDLRFPVGGLVGPDHAGWSVQHDGSGRLGPHRQRRCDRGAAHRGAPWRPRCVPSNSPGNPGPTPTADPTGTHASGTSALPVRD
jgi:hypothetical protein